MAGILAPRVKIFWWCAEPGVGFELLWPRSSPTPGIKELIQL